jgi:hypothetical protein
MSVTDEYIEQANRDMANTAAEDAARATATNANAHQQAQDLMQNQLVTPKPGSFGSLGAITGRMGGAYYPGQ